MKARDLAGLAASVGLALGIVGTGLLPSARAQVANTWQRVLVVPFQRVEKTFSFPVTTTSQTYMITQPAEAESYRGNNACAADIVISSVPATAPVTTEPVVYNGETIPNVLRVTSPTGQVNQFEDTFYFARTGRALASVPNPMQGSTRYVSIMALFDPGAPCLFRLNYGGGS
ncbi:hypothetical protein WYO_0199 [Methylobacterium sp. GXF4]|uniref:hypothetical protein n=1 Tax=Methylobacterium sp. GXF4 TaxID=1096546 RepID=UPI0002698F5F|nr:hypothetical protein [Methylobacterium sp. GXF4]EIZ87162.1 hypothetical protein WYO_0199 [Methylobacterium sp. GXF4]